MAWMGLASSFDTSLDYIKEWWEICPAPERQAEINQFVFTGLKTEGRAEVRRLLSHPSRSWPDALKTAVDSALKKNGIKEGLRAKPRIYESSIADAAIAA